MKIAQQQQLSILNRFFYPQKNRIAFSSNCDITLKLKLQFACMSQTVGQIDICKQRLERTIAQMDLMKMINEGNFAKSLNMHSVIEGERKG
ncbi:hypothetical protein T11_2714 [Trichinella zimbabwensis]|uniref:Uncharacterized protein n=1 Tax=Trichinella zimbabwensis TaxID=268475 RepID=A0A0V1H3D2_9BILA|nr:hypothetical protein T11_2714 [Trichinella zimbabwensis]